MRAALVVAIAAVLLLGACGGSGDSNSSTTSSGKANGTTGTTAKEAPGDHRGKTQARRKKGSKRDGGARKPSKAQLGAFEGSGNVFFYKGRARCLTIPVAILARIYQASSDNPKAVARAYADREAPAPIYRRASIAGCLAGIESRRKR